MRPVTCDGQDIAKQKLLRCQFWIPEARFITLNDNTRSVRQDYIIISTSDASRRELCMWWFIHFFKLTNNCWKTLLRTWVYEIHKKRVHRGIVIYMGNFYILCDLLTLFNGHRFALLFANIDIVFDHTLRWTQNVLLSVRLHQLLVFFYLMYPFIAQPFCFKSAMVIQLNVIWSISLTHHSHDICNMMF